ncbi:MAG: RIP metalloprotease RseP [Eubacteriales bacterium]|nr:RIP metalloprotease RseP [Eubacteriales bacterium]
MGILIGIILLSILMIIHELGHFLTGLKLGFRILEFNLFMGPSIYSKVVNGIQYNIKLLPIGASVRFAGEEGEDDPGYDPNDPGLFYNRPKWARAIVIGTGPAVNLLAGVLAFLIMFSTFGYTIPVIQETMRDTLADQAGLVAGDRILEANGKPVRTTLDYTAVEMFTKVDQPITLTIHAQDGSTRTVVLEPKTAERFRLGVTVEPELRDGGAIVAAVDPNSNNGQPLLRIGDVLLAANGIDYLATEGFRETVQQSAGQPITVDILREGQPQTVTMVATRFEEVLPRGVWFATDTAFLPAVNQSVQWSWSIVKVTLKSIGAIFTGQAKAEDTLSGPVGVVSMVSNVVENEQPLRDKIYQLLWMFALISVSLGFMNLLPIPPLDGHHLILIGVEAIRGKRLAPRTQTVIGVVGLALIVFLGLAGLFFDVLRLMGG